MAKNIKVTSNFQSFDFLNYYKNNRSEKYIYRCLACHYIQSGKGYREISSLLLFHKNSIMEWIRKFEEGGINCLLSISPGRGRKAKLLSSERDAFADSVVALQDARSGGKITGDDIVAMVKSKYKINYSRSGMYKVLSRMGMSWVSSRSKHPQHNIEDQESFKKTSLLK